MKLLAVILSVSILAAGCSCIVKNTPAPAAQPQPIIEVPTYTGVTQYDYKAGDPNVPTNPQLPVPPEVSPQFTKQPDPVSNTPSANSYGWATYYYYPPIIPAPVSIYSGTVAIIVE